MKRLCSFIAMVMVLFLSGCNKVPESQSNIMHHAAKNPMAKMPKDVYEDTITAFSKILHIPLAYANDKDYVQRLHKWLIENATKDEGLAQYIVNLKTNSFNIISDLNKLEEQSESQKLLSMVRLLDLLIERYRFPTQDDIKQLPGLIQQVYALVNQAEKELGKTNAMLNSIAKKYNIDPNSQVANNSKEAIKIIFNAFRFIIDELATKKRIDEDSYNNIMLLTWDVRFSHVYVIGILDKFKRLVVDKWSLDILPSALYNKHLKLPEPPKVDKSDPRLYIYIPMYWATTNTNNLKAINMCVNETMDNKAGRILLKQCRNKSIETGKRIYLDKEIHRYTNSCNFIGVVNVDLNHEYSRNYICIYKDTNDPKTHKKECINTYSRGETLFHELKHLYNYIDDDFKLSRHLCENYLYDSSVPYIARKYLFNDEELHVILGLHDKNIKYVNSQLFIKADNINKLQIRSTYDGKKFKSFEDIFGALKKNFDQFEEMLTTFKPHKLNPDIDYINEFVYEALHNEEYGRIAPRWQHAYINRYRVGKRGFDKIMGVIAKHYGLKKTNVGDEIYLEYGQDFFENIHNKLAALEKVVDERYKVIAAKNNCKT